MRCSARFFSALSLLLWLSACTTVSVTSPTSVPLAPPTATRTPTSTPTSTPTATEAPIPGVLIPASPDLPLPQGAVAWELPGVLLDLAYSPNGDQLAVATSPQGVFIYQSSSMELQLVLQSEHEPVVLAWSPDGSRLATGSKDGTVSVWNVNTAEEMAIFEIGSNWIASVSWNPDGERLAAGVHFGSGKGSVTRVWDVATGQDTVTLEGLQNYYPYVDWSPDGERLAGACTCNMVMIWDGSTGNSLFWLNGYEGGEYNSLGEDIAWSPAGDRIAYAEWPYDAILIYDPNTGEKLAILTDYSPEGLTLVGSFDGEQLGNPHHASHLLASAQELTLAWSPDGERLASGSSEGTVRIWDMATMQEVIALDNLGPIGSLAWSPDGKYIAIGTDVLILWDVSGIHE